MKYCYWCGSAYILKQCQICDEFIYQCDCENICNQHECVRCGALVEKTNEGELCDRCFELVAALAREGKITK